MKKRSSRKTKKLSPKDLQKLNGGRPVTCFGGKTPLQEEALAKENLAKTRE